MAETNVGVGTGQPVRANLAPGHERDGNLNVSPKMSHGVLECDIVVLQNQVLTIL